MDYSVTYKHKKFKIEPTNDEGASLVTIAVGNAKITFDPNDLPDAIDTIIEGDAIGTFTSSLDYSVGGNHINFSGVKNKKVKLKDDDGKEHTVRFKELQDVDFESEQSSYGMSVPHSTNKCNLFGDSNTSFISKDNSGFYFVKGNNVNKINPRLCTSGRSR